MTAPEQRHIRPSHAYFNAIRRSDQYLVERSRHNEDDHDRRALGATALHFVAEREAASEYLDLDVQAVRLIGLLDGFASGEHEQDQIQERMRNGERVSREEKIPSITRIVLFNHAFRELIDTNQGLSVAEIENFIGSAAVEMYQSTEERAFVLNRLKLKMIGMQHEVVAEQALWTIGGVEDVIHAGVEDELRGVDLIVVYKGRTIYLDIKSSEKAAEASRVKSRIRDGHRIVWSGISTYELNGEFRAKPDKVADAADHLEAMLISARPESIAN